jgi:hypothetical protein
MVQIGNHAKLTLPHSLRERFRQFYGEVCGCKFLGSPRPDLDLFEFAGGFVVGAYFTDESKTLPEAEQKKAIWLELKVPDPKAFEAKVEAFGIERMHYDDQKLFYFQAPGGQVFRIAPLEGGV